MRARKDLILMKIMKIQSKMLNHLLNPSTENYGAEPVNPAHVTAFTKANVYGMANNALKKVEGDYLDMAQFNQFVRDTIMSDFIKSDAANIQISEDKITCHEFLTDQLNNIWPAMQPQARLLKWMGKIETAHSGAERAKIAVNAREFPELRDSRIKQAIAPKISQANKMFKKIDGMLNQPGFEEKNLSEDQNLRLQRLIKEHKKLTGAKVNRPKDLTVIRTLLSGIIDSTSQDSSAPANNPNPSLLARR